VSQIGQWLQIDAREPSIFTAAFEVKLGNATIIVRPDFDPNLLAGIVRELELC
jgi:hypothetical protein